jgi:hypothetical protein
MGESLGESLLGELLGTDRGNEIGSALCIVDCVLSARHNDNERRMRFARLYTLVTFLFIMTDGSTGTSGLSNFCGKRFTRTDLFTLRTKRFNLECSRWEPVERATDLIPVVVYIHGNSSVRVEVIPQLSYLLSLGLAVFVFDFAALGKSDGKYVSLGH